MFIHGKGETHGFINPLNVFLSRGSNSDLTAKLGCFGLDEEARGPEAAYWPRERLEGQAFGPPVDMFAVGVLLYSMLTTP